MNTYIVHGVCREDVNELPSLGRWGWTLARVGQQEGTNSLSPLPPSLQISLRWALVGRRGHSMYNPFWEVRPNSHADRLRLGRTEDSQEWGWGRFGRRLGWPRDACSPPLCRPRHGLQDPLWAERYIRTFEQRGARKIVPFVPTCSMLWFGGRSLANGSPGRAPSWRHFRAATSADDTPRWGIIIPQRILSHEKHDFVEKIWTLTDVYIKITNENGILIIALILRIILLLKSLIMKSPHPFNTFKIFSGCGSCLCTNQDKMYKNILNCSKNGLLIDQKIYWQ